MELNGIGALIGGMWLYLFVFLAVAMNVGGYWFSDRLALNDVVITKGGHEVLTGALARSADEVNIIRTLVESQSAAGLDLSFLPDPASVREIAPAVSSTVLAASWCPTDGHADPIATVSAFLTHAERLGARFSMGERVLRLEHQGSRIVEAVTDQRRIAAGAVLAAPGIFVNTLLEPLGLSVPLRRPMVTVMRTAPCAPLLKPVLGAANADMAARQEVSGRLCVTSGAEEWMGRLDEIDGRPVVRPAVRRLRETIERVSAVLPAFAEAEIESVWGGVLDLTPDALPVIDRAPGFGNLVVAAGFSGHGFGIGPVAGPLAADLALGRTPSLTVDAFGFDRFDHAGRNEAALTLHG
jgi:sarcosine oxidase subunit beta